MKITIWRIPRKEHMDFHDTDEKSKKIIELLKENKKLKQKVFELEEELKKHDFKEYVPEDLDFIQVFHDPTHRKVKLKRNTPFGYED